MTATDILDALDPVLAALRTLGARHFVGGSVASSLHGVGRASLDVDVVAELEPSHVGRLVAALSGAYYVDEQKVGAAVAEHRSFNLVHLATMLKIDVFVSSRRAFDRSAFARARLHSMSQDPMAPTVPVAAAEDVLLAKLEWFRRGGEVSDRQWADVLGLLNVGRGTLDDQYLRHWARLLGVLDLYERALGQAAR